MRGDKSPSGWYRTLFAGVEPLLSPSAPRLRPVLGAAVPRLALPPRVPGYWGVAAVQGTAPVPMAYLIGLVKPRRERVAGNRGVRISGSERCDVG
jgi:hypothetical protein